MRLGPVTAACAALITATVTQAQVRPADPAALVAAEAEAMKPLAWMQGRWQGTAWAMTPSGRHEEIQTERIGPFLDGSLMVMEGKAFEKDGKPAAFNAFGVMSYDAARKAYALHSYAQGRAGDFPLEVRPDGYTWKIAAGPATIRYTGTFKDGVLREVGELVQADGTTTQIFEMNLRRVGDSDWPKAGQFKAPGR
jgi:hypothetical protein